MTQVKIVLVGTDSTSRQRITRQLMKFHQFSRFAMLDGMKRCAEVLYGETNTYSKDIHATVKWRMYDALYKIDPEIFLIYMDQRIRKTSKSIVIPDPHYVSEVKALQDRGFIIVRVVPEDRQRKTAHYIKDATPGTVALYEWFPNSGQGYKPYYQVLYSFDDKERNTASVNNMVETLKLRVDSMYTKLEPQSKEVQYIEEEVRSSDKIDY